MINFLVVDEDFFEQNKTKKHSKKISVRNSYPYPYYYLFSDQFHQVFQESQFHFIFFFCLTIYLSIIIGIEATISPYLFSGWCDVNIIFVFYLFIFFVIFLATFIIIKQKTWWFIHSFIQCKLIETWFFLWFRKSK